MYVRESSCVRGFRCLKQGLDFMAYIHPPRMDFSARSARIAAVLMGFLRSPSLYLDVITRVLIGEFLPLHDRITTINLPDE